MSLIPLFDTICCLLDILCLAVGKRMLSWSPRFGRILLCPVIEYIWWRVNRDRTREAIAVMRERRAAHQRQHVVATRLVRNDLVHIVRDLRADGLEERVELLERVVAVHLDETETLD